jgi:CcmD family protein
MSHLGFLVAAYVLTAVSIGAYLLSLVRRQRALERRLSELRPQGVRGGLGELQGRRGEEPPGG